MRQFFAATRHSSTWILAALVTVVTVLVALTSRRDGLDLWADVVTGLSQATIFTGPLAAGFCAFESSRWVGPASSRLSGAVRVPVAARFLHASAVIFPVLFGYMLALAILALTGIFSGRYGAPYVLWLCALAASLVAAATFGYAVGIIGGRGKWYLAPLAALSFLALYVLSRAVPLPYGIRSLVPVVTNTDSVFVRHLPAAMVGQSLLFVGSSVLVLCIVGLGWRQATGRMIMLVAGAVVITGVGAIAVLSTNGQYTTGFNSRDFVCDEEDAELTICLNRGYAQALPKLRKQFDELNRRAAGTDLVAVRLEQNVEGVGDEPGEGARSVYVEENNEFGVVFAASRYVTKYGGFYECDPEDMGGLVAVSIVNTWLTGYDELGIGAFGDGAPGATEFQEFMKMDLHQGNQWMRAHETEYMTCTLVLSDLP